MLKQRCFFSTLLLISFIAPIRGVCQEVIKAPESIYFKEATKKTQLTLTYADVFIPTYFFDTTTLSISEGKYDYYKKYFLKAPIKLDECIYIAPINKLTASYKIRYTRPFSFLFYSDTLNYIDKENDKSEYLSYLKLKRPFEDFYEPFYFKKTEVMNKEYKEFVYWVRDSIARRALSEDGRIEFFLNPNEPETNVLNHKKEIPWQERQTYEVLEFMYLPMGERFYTRKEFNSKTFNYSFIDENKDVNSINVYPDTLAWVNNFAEISHYLEPLTNMYFWHPAFDSYPVVGITQLQAKAYLIWKTKEKQKELISKNSNYIIKYELPDEMEWEMVATASKEKNQPIIYSDNYKRQYDENYITDLLIKMDTTGFTIKHITKTKDCEPCKYDVVISFPELFQLEMKKKPVKFAGIGPARFIPVNLYNSEFKVNKKEYYPKALIQTLKDENDIYFMADNVSEWLRDTYKENWLPSYTYHQNKLRKINTNDARLLLIAEDHYNSQNDQNGVLVRGGNWYDSNNKRSSEKDIEGMSKKIFIDPNKAFCTIGFRYVVKVYRKDEIQTRIKDTPTITPVNKEEYKKAKPN